MLRNMTAVQFNEWQIMFREWNLGEDPNYRADLRLGIAASTAINIAKGGKGTATKPQDVMPKFIEMTDELRAQQQQSLLEGMRGLANKSKKPKTAKTTAK